MKRTIELIRVSTESQAAEDKASIQAQRAINRRTAMAYGLTIVRSIELSDVSGSAVLKAPEIQELLRLMESPEIHGVVTREFSRLMRPENYADYALLQVFVDTNTWLYLPEGPINFASTDGRLLGTLRAAMAGVERLDLLKKTWAAREEKRRKGELAQSRIVLPFGVDYPWRYTADAEKVREAFRLFLTGETSYTEIGRKVGIRMENLRNILRNPIYTGWRVIDKKRDMSLAGKYTTKNGRQGDRRKIARAPEEVIRVKVLEPLISESEFNHAQRLIELKTKRRTKPVSRFTYNSFLSCSLCNGIIYTKYRRADYYVCKARHITHTCEARYMRKERLEPELDQLFAKRLTNPRVLSKLVNGLNQKRPAVDAEALAERLAALETKRQRVLDYYFEGGITADERDARITEVENEQRIVSGLLAKNQPNPNIEVDRLVELFSVFNEFDLLQRTDKRALLGAISPEILVNDYKIDGLFFSLDVIPVGTDS
ncbi:MAG TPA: recombinase family protein [Pyrinomonadaceae bacterium]|jgi:DNA invertase Pin-like site-specific DNA recombinase